MARRLEIEARLDANGIRSGAAAAESSISQLKGAAVSLGAAIGVAFGTQQIIQFGRESVRLAAEEEQAFKRLENQIRAMGGSWKDSKEPLMDWFSRIQEATSFADDEASEAFRTLLTRTNDYNAAMRDLLPVLGFATTGLADVQTIADAVAKAEGGVDRQLKMLIPSLRESTDALGDFRKQYGDRAAEELDTYAGKVKRLKNEVDDFKESIGRGIIGLLTGDLAGAGAFPTLPGMESLQQYLKAKWNQTSPYPFAPGDTGSRYYGPAIPEGFTGPPTPAGYVPWSGMGGSRQDIYASDYGMGTQTMNMGIRRGGRSDINDAFEWTQQGAGSISGGQNQKSVDDIVQEWMKGRDLIQGGLETMWDAFTTKGKNAGDELAKYLQKVLVQELMGKLAGVLMNALAPQFGLAKYAI